MQSRGRPAYRLVLSRKGTIETRRRFPKATGTAAVAGLAGCSSGGGGGRGLGPVPSEYETATGLDGVERDPDSVQAKQAVEYQSQPNSGQQCSDCRHYIPDKNGDGLGACTLVEAKIEPTGWCVTFSEYPG